MIAHTPPGDSNLSHRTMQLERYVISFFMSAIVLQLFQIRNSLPQARKVQWKIEHCVWLLQIPLKSIGTYLCKQVARYKAPYSYPKKHRSATRALNLSTPNSKEKG